MKWNEIDHLSQLPVQTVFVRGGSEERGYQYGSQTRELIKKSLLIYKDIVKTMRGEELVWEDLLDEAKAFIPGLKRYDRLYFNEMKGIAEGAGVSLEEIVFLNARSEIMNPAWSKRLIPEGCTSFLLQPSVTSNGEYYIGQTYDWFPACSELLIILHVEDEAGHEFITVTEAGILAKIGCNNSGVGVLLNYLNNFEINRSGTPYNILLRRALDSRSYTDAQRNIMRSPIAFGLNMFIADRSGAGIDYELAANGMDFFYPQEGMLVHTNHHISQTLSTRTFNKKMYPGSVNRYDTARRLLGRSGLGMKDLMGLVSYHDDNDAHNSICRHELEDEYQIETIFTMIIELTRMELYLCFNPPCSNPFYKISLSNVFNKLGTSSVAT
jgi:isopenicillin-N N-acyltransferase like protein